MRVGIVQQRHSANIDDNILKLTTSIKDLAMNGAKLIVLSELHNSLYFCQREDVDNFDLAGDISDIDIYLELSKQCEVVIVLSLFEKRAKGLYHNTSVVVDNGVVAGKYRKMHIPDDPAFYEKFYFTPGDIGFEPINTSLGKLGILVCWDQWYPEAARIMALKGADILIYPTAIGWDLNDTDEEKHRQLNAWITIQKSHSIANGLFVISANRVELERDGDSQIDFWGNSFVSGPQGEIIIKANEVMETNLIADIDLNRIENVRRIWPFFRDRRIDAYGDILKRWGI
jgi:N-carbamoylputrescine amidase